MSDAFVIEVADETAGIVVRLDNEKSYRFHAALPRYFPLDGKSFATPRDAERAVIAHSGRLGRQTAKAA